MPAQKKRQRVTDQIVEVEEASCDPEIGQSVRLAVRVATRTLKAAADVNVIFETQPGPARVTVKSDSEGWATFTYKSTTQGKTQVTAVVEGSKAKTASHVFDLYVVKAGVWDDARIMLNSDAASEAVWGTESRFPRTTPATHTITLNVAAGSALLNRDVQLGVMSESSLDELGIAGVTPALGTKRLLTATGLSWTFTVIEAAGGTYFLVLAADRLINQSSENHMSLGPIPPAPALAT